MAELEPLIARITQAEQTLSGLEASIVTKASVTELTALTGRVRIGSASEASATRDSALSKRVDLVTAQVDDPVTGLAKAYAGIQDVRESAAADNEATASAVRQVSARLDGVGGVGVEQAFNAIVDRTGKIEGHYGISIDAEGNFTGFELIGGASGPGQFNLINVDLTMGTGRIIQNTGTFMIVRGVAFGTTGDLLEWFGPTMPIEECSRANGRSWKAVNGDEYMGGKLSAGAISNAGQTTLASALSYDLGPFASNGKPVTIIVGAGKSKTLATSATWTDQQPDPADPFTGSRQSASITFTLQTATSTTAAVDRLTWSVTGQSYTQKVLVRTDRDQAGNVVRVYAYRHQLDVQTSRTTDLVIAGDSGCHVILKMATAFDGASAISIQTYEA